MIGFGRSGGLGLPPDLALVVKVFITLESLGRRLDPDFDMVGAAKPFLRRVQQDHYRPRALAHRLGQVALEATDLLSVLPQHLRRLLRTASGGRLRMKVDVEQLPGFSSQVAHSANRLALGLVISALIVGSSIVMTVQGGPTLMGLPFFGLAGFLGAVAGGVWLLLSILRSGGGR